MPEVKIEGNWSVGREVIHEQTITLWKNGQRLDAPVSTAGQLQADGWQTWEPDVPKLARELTVWADGLGKAAQAFVADAEKMGLIEAAEGAPYHVLVRAKAAVDDAYGRLQQAAFHVYSVNEPNREEH